MDFLITILSFIFVLGVLVFIHELGHFLVAKRAGIRVERFSLGYPPKMIGITVGETEYCISWVPLGGYVKVAGMADVGVEEVKGEPWEFTSKPVWVRMCVMAAGPFMNFLLGFVILFGILAFAGEMTIKTTQVGRVSPGSAFEAAGLRPGDWLRNVGGKKVEAWEDVDEALSGAWGSEIPVEVLRDGNLRTFHIRLAGEAQTPPLRPFLPPEIGSVIQGQPADRAGLQKGDRLLSIDGQPVSQWWDVSERIHALPDRTIRIEWLRNGMPMSAEVRTVVHREGAESEGRIGIVPPTERAPVGISKAAVRGAQQTWQLAGLIFNLVGRLVSGRESGQSLAGPLTIAQMTGKSAKQGLEALFGFMALLSVNLAVLNLLPIPVLDGGHLAIMALESLVQFVVRRPFSFTLRQKEVLQQIGLGFLGVLMIYVFYNDIARLIAG
jgi:regulator of sigma E protease